MNILKFYLIGNYYWCFLKKRTTTLVAFLANLREALESADTAEEATERI